jgi:hypothetical protein
MISAQRYLIILMLLSFLGCEKEITTNLTPAVEEWTAVVDTGIGSGMWVFHEQDMGLTATGEWIYKITINQTEYEVRCPFTNGIATINAPQVTFQASGNATIANLPGESSSFNLTVTGTTANGQGNGTYVIIFTSALWPPKIEGTWTGTRVSGGGITP